MNVLVSFGKRQIALDSDCAYVIFDYPFLVLSNLEFMLANPCCLAQVEGANNPVMVGGHLPNGQSPAQRKNNFSDANIRVLKAIDPLHRRK